jgi:hypothetical protein
MKTALKRKNDEFLVTPLKHVLTVMGLVDHLETPKLWAIAHEKGHKFKNNKVFFCDSALNIQTIIFLVILHGIPKQWAIAHENGHKNKNNEFFCHSSLKCTNYHIPCKSPHNL